MKNRDWLENNEDRLNYEFIALFMCIIQCAIICLTSRKENENTANSTRGKSIHRPSMRR